MYFSYDLILLSNEVRFAPQSSFAQQHAFAVHLAPPLTDQDTHSRTSLVLNIAVPIYYSADKAVHLSPRQKNANNTRSKILLGAVHILRNHFLSVLDPLSPLRHQIRHGIEQK